MKFNIEKNNLINEVDITLPAETKRKIRKFTRQVVSGLFAGLVGMALYDRIRGTSTEEIEANE